MKIGSVFIHIVWKSIAKSQFGYLTFANDFYGDFKAQFFSICLVLNVLLCSKGYKPLIE